MAEAAVGFPRPKTTFPRPPADQLLEPFAATRLVAVGGRAITNRRGFLAG